MTYVDKPRVILSVAICSDSDTDVFWKLSSARNTIRKQKQERKREQIFFVMLLGYILIIFRFDCMILIYCRLMYQEDGILESLIR